MTTGELRAQAEKSRQRAVESLQLAERGEHPGLDRITRLARTVFQVPISTVTVLDGDRAWFPSAQGFDVEEMPRADTFCERTVAVDELVVVEDASNDRRFRNLPAVRDGAIRFYAGYPLRDPMGHVLGTFCLFDPEPRRLDGDQLTAFEDMAHWAQQELASSSEMRQASRVQASMLPAQSVRTAGWEVAGRCFPALAVGGDFYDHGLIDGVIHLGLGDVMGKGTGAALVAAGVRAALRGAHAAVTAGADLGVAGTQVARSLLPDLERAESFVTLFQAAIDIEDGRTRYVDAGSGLAVLVDADGTAHCLVSEDRPFGILHDDHWTQHETTLGPGSRLLVVSDGVLDLLDDPVTWPAAMAQMVRSADSVDSLLSAIARLARERTPLDDVTAVAVFRA